jgi:hypothetical protein
MQRIVSPQQLFTELGESRVAPVETHGWPAEYPIGTLFGTLSGGGPPRPWENADGRVPPLRTPHVSGPPLSMSWLDVSDLWWTSVDAVTA